MEMQELGNILFQIDNGVLVLPKFQRGYVWKRADVSELMLSLYKGYPIGHLLVWDTPANPDDVKGNHPISAGVHKLLLDGQQRVTSLYGIVRGKKPAFSDGDAKAFLDLYFNVEDEVFEFHSSKMKNDPLWISVTELMQAEMGEHQFLPKFSTDKQVEYSWKLAKITKIKSRKIFVDTVTSADKTLEDVVDIFNRVNSGGTKLTDGDLAMAKISAKWPGAREEMQERLTKWRNSGYQFSLDWLLRCINAFVTGQSKFQFIAEVSSDEIRNGLIHTEKQVDKAITLISAKLGLVDSSVLRSPNSFPAIVRYFKKESNWPSGRHLDRLLYWYVSTLMWGRYSTSVESRIRQDLLAVDENEDAVGALIERIKQTRGHLRVEPQDFDVAEARSRFFPILYMLTRVNDVPDFCSGLKLSKTDLGQMGMLERHHIFPNSFLKKNGISNRYEINALANFTWLTKPCNQCIGAKSPEEYFPYYEDKHPGILASHWIPMDRELWKIENYRDFLAKRRELLANAANDFLNQLYHGALPEASGVVRISEHVSASRPLSISSDKEEAALQETMGWMEKMGLPRGEYGYELINTNNEVVATFDLAWPDGIQEGLSKPIALLLNEEDTTVEAANKADFRYYRDVGEFRDYVEREVLQERRL